MIRAFLRHFSDLPWRVQQLPPPDRQVGLIQLRLAKQHLGVMALTAGYLLLHAGHGWLPHGRELLVVLLALLVPLVTSVALSVPGSRLISKERARWHARIAPWALVFMLMMPVVYFGLDKLQPGPAKDAQHALQVFGWQLYLFGTALLHLGLTALLRLLQEQPPRHRRAPVRRRVWLSTASPRHVG
jgi:hypothetical protein